MKRPTNKQEAGPSHGMLHVALDVIRRVHCDRKLEPNHDCQGVMSVTGESVYLRCKLCGNLELTHRLEHEQMCREVLITSFERIERPTPKDTKET